MSKTKIQWADYTFNPWHGCSKVSAGCANCYAEKHSIRFGEGLFWGPKEMRKLMSGEYWSNPIRWNARAEKEGRRYRVFCGSMCDIFERHDNPRTEESLNVQRLRLWNLITQTTNLDWLLLTKRPENVRQYIARRWLNNWPSNVWLGTSVENQIGWVIVGGESGSRARPTHPDWVSDIAYQCHQNDIPFFFKQWGTYLPLTVSGETSFLKTTKKQSGRLFQGREWNEFPRELAYV